VENVTDRVSNPFGMQPPCERFVPGYGDANADFHVIGDHPGIHGGWTDDSDAGAGAGSEADGDGDGDGDAGSTPDAGTAHPNDPVRVPFTNAAGLRLQRALADAGLLERVGDPPLVARTFLSYLHMCVPDGDAPREADYGDLERFFDAELRAIAAHVLLPVGVRAVRHVLANYTARAHRHDVDGELDGLHGRELHGSGWLVVPVKEPADWDDEGRDHRRLVDGLRELQRTDFRREADLGRFLSGDDSWYVR
jgi:uracil-DNA glycosylase